MTSAEELAEWITATLPDIKTGSIRLWGVWFGRPYDNCHRIVGCDAAEEAVRIRFDHDEVLSVFSPRRASIDRRTFRIDDADRVLWEWFRYGRPQTAENRCFREFIRSTAGVVSARTNDDASGPLKPIGSEPAVEIV